MRKLTRDEKWLCAGAAAAAFGLYYRRPIVGGVKDVFSRGKQVSLGPLNAVLGIVTVTPAELLKQASWTMGRPVAQEVYALARMIRSEGAEEGELRAHAVCNDLKTFKWANSLFGIITYSTNPQRRGYYGMQYSPPVRGPSPGLGANGKPIPGPILQAANKRRVSSSKDPYQGDILVAEKVLLDRRAGIDKAMGATKFIDKSSMGKQVGSRPFAVVDAEWRSEGYSPFTLPEFGTDLVLYRRT